MTDEPLVEIRLRLRPHALAALTATGSNRRQIALVMQDDGSYRLLAPVGWLWQQSYARPELHWDRDDDRAVGDIIRAGGTVETTTVGEAKAHPHFLPAECPHDPKGWS